MPGTDANEKPATRLGHEWGVLGSCEVGNKKS